MGILLKILKAVVLSMVSFLALLMIVIQLSSWLKLEAPASAVLTLPKMLVTWFSWQIGIISIVVSVLIIICWIVLKRMNNSIQIWTAVIAIVFMLSAMNSFVVSYRMRNAEAFSRQDYVTIMEEKQTSYLGKVTRTDLTVDFKKAISETKFFDLSVPEIGNHREVCILYLNYGNWSAHEDPEMFSYLKKHVNGIGYSYAVFGGRSRYECDITGLVQDIRKAIAYLKDQENGFGIKKVIVSGGSAGGHLALVTAFSKEIPEYRVPGTDESFGIPDGVVSFYSPIDMIVDYETFTGKNEENLNIMDKMGNLVYSKFGGGGKYDSIKASHVDSMNTLLGGTPDSNRHMYDISSVNNIAIDPKLPVFLVHGMHDSNSPPEPEVKWALEAINKGMNITSIQIPHAEHVFDLMMQDASPAVVRTLEVLDAWLVMNFE